MSDEHDTKEITIVQETTPDTPQEGEPMPLTLEMLHAQVEILRVDVAALKEWRTTLLSREQIVDIVRTINAESIERVEKLVDNAMQRFGEIEFSTARLDSIDAKLATRATNAAESDRKLDRVIQFINTLAADDVTDPDAKKTSKSWFERMEEQIAQNEQRSLSAVVEVSQARIDYVQAQNADEKTAREIKDGLAKIDTGLAKIDATNEALNEFKAFAEQIQGVLKAFKHLRENPLQLVALVTAFGTGGYAVPELFRLAVRLLTGAN